MGGGRRNSHTKKSDKKPEGNKSSGKVKQNTVRPSKGSGAGSKTPGQDITVQDVPVTIKTFNAAGKANVAIVAPAYKVKLSTLVAEITKKSDRPVHLLRRVKIRKSVGKRYGENLKEVRRFEMFADGKSYFFSLVTLNEGGASFIHVEPGFHPKLKNNIKRAMDDYEFDGLSPNLIFVNDIGEDEILGEATSEEVQEVKKDKALELVRAYLNVLKIQSLDGGSIEEFLQEVKKRIVFQTVGGMRILEIKLPGIGSAENTEGITTTADSRGERIININLTNHTVPTIVHEIFHTLEFTFSRLVSNELVEGMTEFFAREATGLDLRVDQRNGAELYSDSTFFIRQARASRAIDRNELLDAFLNGAIETERFIYLEKVWADHQKRMSPLSPGMTTRNVPQAEIDEVWAETTRQLSEAPAKEQAQSVGDTEKEATGKDDTEKETTGKDDTEKETTGKDDTEKETTGKDGAG